MGEFIVNNHMEIAVSDQSRIVEQRVIAECSRHGWCYRPGVYVFYCGGKRPVPVYVGKTRRTIKKEAFDVEKIKKINDYLSTSPSCELKMMAVTPRRVQKRKKKRKRQIHNIGEMEKCLISLAALRNRALINSLAKNSLAACMTKGGWSIRGAIRSFRKPKRKNMAQTRIFKRLMGID